MTIFDNNWCLSLGSIRNTGFHISVGVRNESMETVYETNATELQSSTVISLDKPRNATDVYIIHSTGRTLSLCDVRIFGGEGFTPLTWLCGHLYITYMPVIICIQLTRFLVIIFTPLTWLRDHPYINHLHACDHLYTCYTILIDGLQGKYDFKIMQKYFTDCLDGYYGWLCEELCTCKDPAEVCDKVLGSCPQTGCRTGRRGLGCQEREWLTWQLSD